MSYTNHDPRFGFNQYPPMPQQQYAAPNPKKAKPIKALFWWGLAGVAFFVGLTLTNHVHPHPSAAQSRLNHYQHVADAAVSAMREGEASAQTLPPVTEQPPTTQTPNSSGNVVMQAASPTTQPPKAEPPKAQTVVLGGHDLDCAPKPGVDIAKFWSEYKHGEDPSKWSGNEYEPYVKGQVCA